MLNMENYHLFAGFRVPFRSTNDAGEKFIPLIIEVKL